MTLPHMPQVPIVILFPLGAILAVILIIFVVRVLTAEVKKPWYRSPTFMIPIIPLILLVSFFTFRGLGLIVLLLVGVTLAGGALLKRMRRWL